MRGDATERRRKQGSAVAAIEGLPVAAAFVGGDGGIVSANDEWRQAFAPPPGEESGAPGTDLASQLRNAAGLGAPVDLEITVRGPGDQPRSFAGRCAPSDLALPKGAVTLCALVEITEVRRREERLAFMASHDALTGLPNRHHFEEELLRTLARAQRGKQGALIMLDIDHLKSYNDALGHARGDQALVNFALLLQTHLRAGDMIARVGGDEFAVVLEDATLEESVEIAERMRAAAAEEAFVADARAYGLGLSAGVVPFSGFEESPRLVDMADSALYEAKNSGRNRVVVRDTGVSAATDMDSRKARTVREALTEGRIRVHYQPVIRIADGTIAYFEALVRLPAEDGGLLLPSSFLAVAERLGLMPRLTRAVFDHVADALVSLGAARVSLNLCGSDLVDRSLLDYVLDGLVARGVDPSRLSFEISEHVVASHREALSRWFEQLSVHGCVLVLDRFSAGARGLALVNELPFSQVKLDVSTLARLTDEGGGAEYLEAVRKVVEAHGLTIVASRIEDGRVLDRVRSAGFAYAQGYDIGRPRSEPE